MTMVFPDERVWKRLFTPPLSTFFERQFAGRGTSLIKSEEVAALKQKVHDCPVELASGEIPAPQTHQLWASSNP